MSTLPETTSQFQRDRYLLLRELLSPAECERLRASLWENASTGKLVPDAENDPAGKTSVGLNRQPVLEELLLKLLPVIEEINGKALYPTYSYGRIYRRGADLYKHVDRNACEVSLSLCLGYEAPAPWPLWVEGPHGTTAAAMQAGDAVAYRGIECPHWREQFDGEWNAQVFLHYVEKDGPHAKERYDRRASLNLPAAQATYGNKPPEPGQKYLHFRLPSAPEATLATRVAALEMGVAVAALSDRVLVLEDVLEGQGQPRLSDLYHLPVAWDETRRLNLANLSAVPFMPRPLQHAVIVHPPETPTHTADFLAFAHGRTYVFRIGHGTRKVDVLKMTCEHPDPVAADHYGNMALWSSTLYLDEASREKVHALLAQVEPKAPLQALAAEIIHRLGDYDAVHLSAKPYHALPLPVDEIVARLGRVCRADRPLLVLTDDPSCELVQQVRAAHAQALVWSEYAQIPTDLPAGALEVVGFLVAAGARHFLGTLGSLETALIQRRRLGDAFRFVSPVVQPDGQFATEKELRYPCRLLPDGQMVEGEPLRFSWTALPGLPSSAWIREWPECRLAALV